MSTKRKVYKHDEWMRQIDDAYEGKTLVCPYCKKKAGKVSFFFFPNQLGFATVKCENCGSYETLISRMEKSDKIKCDVTELEM